MTPREPPPAGLPGWWLLLILPALGAAAALIVLLTASGTSPARTPTAVAVFPTPPEVRFETPTPRPTIPPTPTVPPPMVGRSVADLAFDTLDGGVIRLADLRGQVIFLNVWATWCTPCRAEMPVLQEFFEAAAGRAIVIALTDPTDGQTLDAIHDFVDSLGLTFPIALASDPTFFQRWGVRQIPTTFIIDAEGVVRLWHVGEMHDHDLQDYAAALLK